MIITNNMESTTIPGLQYIPDFITVEEERQLVQFIDAQPWNTDLRRRTQHYGYRYDYTKSTIDDPLGPLPCSFDMLCDRLVQRGIFEDRPVQVIVNEYEPGQGISPHIDKSVFGPVVASLSLLSSVPMEMSKDDEKQEVRMRPRSLLVLSQSARYKWKHGIVARKSDSLQGQRVSRGRRISITFRTLAN